MKMASRKPTPRYCIQHNRFVRENGWELQDMSLSVSGNNIAVSGFNINTRLTLIDLYKFSDFGPRYRPKLVYAKEFEQYVSEGKIHVIRRVSFVDAGDDNIVTCIGNKLEVIQVSKDNVLRSRGLNGFAYCMSVRGKEIFIAFKKSNKIIVYSSIDLKEMKAVMLEGIEHGDWPQDITVVADRIFATVRCKTISYRSLIFEENSGRILTELTSPANGQWWAGTITVNISLGLVVVIWRDSPNFADGVRFQIAYYSLLRDNFSSFLIEEIESNVTIIRISDRGERMVTKNWKTGELKIYDMAELFSYGNLIEILASQIQPDDCVKLLHYFNLAKGEADAIMKSDKPAKSILHTLEEKGVIQSSNVNRLTEAFIELKINSSRYHVSKIYQNTRNIAQRVISYFFSNALPNEVSARQCALYHKVINNISFTSFIYYSVHIRLEALPFLLLAACITQIVGAMTGLETNSFSTCPLVHVTPYSEFLATLSTHLTETLAEDLSNYFNISDEKKTYITSNQKPGLSLLLVLDEMGVINRYNVENLGKPFTELRLVQAVTKIHEYQTIREEEKNRMEKHTYLTEEEKKSFLIQCLRKKIKIWYETMSPVPWKRSCKWKLAELYVGSGLVLSDTKTNRGPQDIDEQCKLEYTDIFNHERLKSKPRIIVEGDPGSGKTMLAYQLAYDWSQGKISGIDILVLLPLKFVENKTLVKALHELYIPQQEDLSEGDIQSFITDEGSSCCFILDGLEEYNGGTDTSEVVKVMTKTKYPTCKVILTTRSNYAQDYTDWPILKLGIFGEKERNTYIDKVFRHDLQMQLQVKKTIEDNPFILDICSVPVLFVLTVHNIESVARTETGCLDRVSPFMRSIVGKLCPSMTPNAKAGSSDPVNQIPGEISLEEIAYNGLCKGLQQLSWQKDFIEKNVLYSKQWLDSGILSVVDSNSALVGMNDQRQTLSERLGPTPDTESSIGVKEKSATIKNSTSERVVQPSLRSVSDKSLSEEVVSEISSQKADEAGLIAKQISFQVKFLHKIVQEWFAAKHFALMMSTLQTEKDKYRFVNENLPCINPADLHYVLRFSCALHSPCFRFIIEYLLENHCQNRNFIPIHIMNCVFLCYAEYGGGIDPDVLNCIGKICKRDIVIHSDDGRLLQQAKASLLKVASDNGILIRKLSLTDLLVSAKKDVLTFNSGVTLKVLDTVTLMEVSRWDHRLTEKDYHNIVDYISKCSLLEEAHLNFPSQPPTLDKELLVDLEMKNKGVTWNIGSRLTHTLNTSSGRWMLDSSIRHTFIDLYSTKVNNGWVTMSTGKLLSNEGGILRIPETGVKLEIPPNAFQNDSNHYNIQLRLLDRTYMYKYSTAFACDSTVAVELLPNHLQLKQPAVLTLPHCLKLTQGTTHEAEVFISHHEEGNEPQWERQSPSMCQLNERACLITLNEFCWVVCVINDRVVEAKHLQVYTAGKRVSPNDKIAKIEVGYYPDLDGAGKLLRMNRNWIVGEQKPFLFMKDGRFPLQILFNEVAPPVWKYCMPHDNPKIISFQTIASSTESSCPFILQKYGEGPSYCIFKVSQASEYIELTSPLQVEETNYTVQDMDGDESQREPSFPQFSSSKSEEPGGAVGGTVSGIGQHDEREELVAPGVVEIYEQVKCRTFEGRGQKNHPEVQTPYFGLLPYRERERRGFPFPVVHHYGHTQNIYLNRESDEPHIQLEDENVEEHGLLLRYSVLNKVAMKLDQEDPLGQNWKELADELGFTWEEILTFERKSKPTLAVVQSAVKRGTLKSLRHLKAILEKIQRVDAAELIPN